MNFERNCLHIFVYFYYTLQFLTHFISLCLFIKIGLTCRRLRQHLQDHARQSIKLFIARRIVMLAIASAFFVLSFTYAILYWLGMSRANVAYVCVVFGASAACMERGLLVTALFGLPTVIALFCKHVFWCLWTVDGTFLLLLSLSSKIRPALCIFCRLFCPTLCFSEFITLVLFAVHMAAVTFFHVWLAPRKMGSQLTLLLPALLAELRSVARKEKNLLHDSTMTLTSIFHRGRIAP